MLYRYKIWVYFYKENRDYFWVYKEDYWVFVIEDVVICKMFLYSFVVI